MKAELSARRFRVEVIEEQPRSGFVGEVTVNIFDGDSWVGAYRRNYPSFGEETFEPFEIDGAWYALYSSDYTATRVMSLPDCRDLGGEEPASDGFCPVELYVPRYRKVMYTQRATGEQKEKWVFEARAETYKLQEDNAYDYGWSIGPWLSLSTGFVAGCIWGDDSTWKVQVFDLSEAAKGKIVRTERFGHLELAEGISLADSLDFDRHMPHWELRATVIRRERRDVATGKLIDPYDE
ncbi:hypothetical protein [Mesorhizobium carmichaelinearum]|uniref:hypothetical protein n=1 Tax=Mesorhizobium carmichaelinearum TaxID=1208188 RepID=UPI000BA328EA|nr:hypothetical protein [Mesorhizobium carmichaelinearum]